MKHDDKRRDPLRPLARILSYCTTGVDPMIMGMGPVEALKRAADRAEVTLDDLDLFELNEAFASQSVAVARELNLDPARVNVHGGAIALGHPIGASGGCSRRLFTRSECAAAAGEPRPSVSEEGWGSR